MIYCKLFRYAIGLTMVMLFVAVCGGISAATPTPEAPAATPTPRPAVEMILEKITSQALEGNLLEDPADPLGVSELRLVVDPGGQLHAAWVWRVGVGNGDVFYQSLALKRFLPVIVRKAEQPAPPPLPFWWP